MLRDEPAEILLVQAHARQCFDRGLQSQPSERERHQLEDDRGFLDAVHAATLQGWGSRSGVHAREIEKNTRFQLLLVEAMPDQIADTHDALQLIILDWHAFFDGTRFSVTAAVDFDVPGTVRAVADFRVLTGTGFDPAGYRYQDGVGLVDLNGTTHTGDEPYIVLSLDGRERDHLKTFTPTVASAAVLQRFFQIGEGRQVPIDTIVHTIQLASDFKYREQAIALKEGLAAESDPAKKAQLQAQRRGGASCLIGRTSCCSRSSN